MVGRIDINCDMGESFGAYSIGNDEKVIRYITSANIACGFHASDPGCMEKTVRLCKKHGVMVGAHPGYPDLLGFGRRFMDVSVDELTNYIIYQAGALKGFLDLHGMPLQHIKLHGALYNYMAREVELFLAVAGTVQKAFKDVIFLVLGGRQGAFLKNRAAEQGLRLALEGFPDRQYTDQGELQDRQHKGAVIKDPDTIAQRAVDMARDKGIESVSGQRIVLEADTLCIHGDNPESIRAAKKIRTVMKKEHIQVTPFSEFI